MDGKVLVTETNYMTNPQNTSDSRKPLKWGFFMSELGLSELCQKKTIKITRHRYQTLVKYGASGRT